MQQRKSREKQKQNRTLRSQVNLMFLKDLMSSPFLRVKIDLSRFYFNHDSTLNKLRDDLFIFLRAFERNHMRIILPNNKILEEFLHVFNTVISDDHIFFAMNH